MIADLGMFSKVDSLAWFSVVMLYLFFLIMLVGGLTGGRQ